jgi:shikimate kinase
VRGVATATSAITIVNALPTGIGAAAGIALPVRAEIDLHPTGSSEKWDVDVEEPARTPLVIASLTAALRRYAPGSSGSGTLALRSEIPSGRGLKSSSAVSSAVALAVARATGSEPPAIEIARLSATASLEAGVSATGAFDDALAGLTAGIVVTNNREQEMLASFPVDPDWRAALFIPESRHRPAPELHAAFARESKAAQPAVAAALDGDWRRAMRENSRLVERVLGYEYAELRSELDRRGALASGVSGLGPTLAAVAPSRRVDRVVAAFPAGRGARRAVALTSGSPSREEPAA